MEPTYIHGLHLKDLYMPCSGPMICCSSWLEMDYMRLIPWEMLWVIYRCNHLEQGFAWS